jgi:hypothetical protein
MANQLKQKLIERLTALQTQRSEKAAEFQGQLARYDEQITAIRDLAQSWDTLTVDEALAALDKTGIHLELKS